MRVRVRVRVRVSGPLVGRHAQREQLEEGLGTEGLRRVALRARGGERARGRGWVGARGRAKLRLGSGSGSG